jgi:tetratricopeptide (TPR) repeat protein
VPTEFPKPSYRKGLQVASHKKVRDFNKLRYRMQEKCDLVGDYHQLCHHYQMRYVPLFTLLCLLLAACSTTPAGDIESSITPETENSVATAESELETVDSEPEPSEKADIEQRPFPGDSLYPLLVAEFALRRSDYQTALSNYMEQAPELRDSGVSAHTARLAQYLQKDTEAVAATTLWVELEPDNLEARLTLANLLARKGRATEALPHMTVIVRAGGIANFTALANGFSQLNSTQQGELLAAVDKVHREFPDNTQLLICKALMLEALDQKEKSLAILQRVFEVDPRQLQAIVLEAKLRQDLGQSENLYDRIEATLAEQPDNTRLRMQYARLLTRTDMGAARTQFQLLLDDSPNDPALLFSLALIEREMGELTPARKKLERLVGLDKRRDEAHYYLGRIAEQEERIEDALMHYMQVNPGRDFINATRRLGSILLRAQRQQDHSDYFMQLRQRFPQFKAQLYAVEVESLDNYGLFAATAMTLNQALVELPNNTSLQYMRSMTLEKLGDLQGMEADLRSILEREPANATVLNALGYTLANKTDRYEEAEILIEQALALEPNEPAILDSYGWVKYRLGDHQGAVKYLQLAYNAFPDPEVAAHLGEVLWVAGDTEAALKIWATALSRNPSHKVLLETMQRMGALD